MTALVVHGLRPHGEAAPATGLMRGSAIAKFGAAAAAAIARAEGNRAAGAIVPRYAEIGSVAGAAMAPAPAEPPRRRQCGESDLLTAGEDRS